MEQVIFFLTEYSSRVIMGLNGLVLILLAVALHRMRKLKKQIRETAGKLQEYLEKGFLDIAQQKQYAADSELQPDGQEIDTAGTLERQMAGMNESAVEETPENLIDAVLGEVFP